MKDSHLISYDIFCQRTKFSLDSFLRKNLVSYDRLTHILRNKKVEPPKVETYQEIFDNIEKEKLEKEKLEKEKFEKEKIKISSSILQKPKAKRRRRKNKND